MIPIATGQAVSTAANTTASVTVNKSYEFLGKGRIVLAARGSAAGMQVNLLVGGVQLARNTAVPFIGTTGALSQIDHTFLDQRINGGRVEFELVNTTGGALTTDYILGFEPN